MHTMTPLDSSPNYTRLQMWKNQLTDVRATIKLGLEAAEALPAGSDQPWLWWSSLNRLRTRIGRANTTMRRWGYIDNTQSVNCDCGELQTMTHLLCCRILDEPCSPKTSSLSQRGQGCVPGCGNILTASVAEWLRAWDTLTMFEATVCGMS